VGRKKDRLPPPPTFPISRALMSPGAAAPPILQTSHLLGIEGLSIGEITSLLDLADEYVALGRAKEKKSSRLKGHTVINLFF
jgi:hypothetical protein